MKTKELVALALFVAIGAALHAVIPPFFYGMKPDMMLIMMFMGILLFPKLQNVLVIGIVTGIISALTTAFPGGQLPNIIDKPITSLIFFGAFLAVRKLGSRTLTAAGLTAVGTLISGTVFLTSALLIVGLPGNQGLMTLFFAVVLPTAVISTIAMFVIYPIVQAILKRSRLTEEVK
ncbi:MULTISPECIES: tryptophan transporter [Bacillus]|uniref:Tryptophan transporter n=1 Tax=Bacillus glycinifermentans TaxID=1664069 RepID=A0AAJ3YWP7_9BACI|nr:MULTISPECIES: tryptophan transporter [Bacillus]KKB73730.1 tryptophan transporter [Bacillus sp. TH008]MBU8787836.1 tryptophan transporter [Bacillus glycinifermentans]MDU0073593.1 tryptophan transporter [Bacillus sp. IG6]MED8021465.1 tryptophan transporter [Bacillus glycinifermentans]NUJ18862.1 tryptophan transporter [Bacillus glycinifermentans]